VAGKTSIGGFSTPDVEKIISLSPDLILADSIQEEEVIPRLEEMGLTVVGLSPEDIEGVLEAIILVGEITGTEEVADALVSQMQGEIDSIVNKTKDLTVVEKPLVFYIIWHEPLMTAGSGTMEDELIRLAGGINMCSDLSSYIDISLEAVLAANPDVIITGIGMGTGEDATFQFAKTEPRLAGIPARQNDRIYGVPTDLSGRTGPRLIIALQQFAAAIHLELFPVTE
jgi:iron complex transport system substrate-binding protein